MSFSHIPIELAGRKYKKKRKRKYVNICSKQRPYSRVSGFRTIGKNRYYFRSLWEIQFATYLEYKRKTGHIDYWEYEPVMFSFPKELYKNKPYYYLPDFYVKSGCESCWYEVKGYMDDASKTKIKRFRIHYPEESLIIVSGEWFSNARRKGYHRLMNWEALEKR